MVVVHQHVVFKKLSLELGSVEVGKDEKGGVRSLGQV